MTKQTSCSVVIPVFNSATTLNQLIQRLAQVLPVVADTYEVILVNDGSYDQSWEVITQLAQNHNWVMGINLMRNYSQHNALLCGIRSANYEVIVTMDDDLQNPPEEIPKLLAKLAEGYDVVYGARQQMQHGWWRNASSLLLKRIVLTSLKIAAAHDLNSFRAFRTQIRDAFADYQSSYIFIDVLLTWGTTSFASIPVQHDVRKIGETNYTFWKLIGVAINMVTGFSTWPLQIAIWIGFLFTLFGVGVFIYVISRYLILGYSVPGFPFLASIIAIFSGAQLFSLGIMGEYLARIHLRSMHKPPYTIRESTKKHED